MALQLVCVAWCSNMLQHILQTRQHSQQQQKQQHQLTMFSFSAAGGQQTTAKRHQPHGNSFLLRVLQDNDSPTITTATGGTRSSSRSRSRSWSRPQASKHGHLGAIVNCCCQLREQNMHTATEWMKAARLGSPPPPLLLQLLTTTRGQKFVPKIIMSIARRQAGTSQTNAKAAAEQREAICRSWRHFSTSDESGSFISTDTIIEWLSIKYRLYQDNNITWIKLRLIKLACD